MLHTERLIRLRNEKKMIQEEMAQLLGIGRTTYVKYETGDIQPPNDIVSKLADFFNVTTDYLLNRSEIKKISINEAFLRVAEDAQKRGFNPDDFQKALDFLEFAKKRDEKR